jgi:uncharacterized damage-inducible protein DinB
MSSGEELIGQIDEAKGALYALFHAQSPEALAQRPPSGEWSVVENVRHLLFAEQLHLGRLLPEGFSWSGLGLRTDGRRRPPEVGSQPTDDIEEVLAAWDAVHAPIRDAALSTDGADQELQRNLRHLLRHVRIIEALLEDQRAAP